MDCRNTGETRLKVSLSLKSLVSANGRWSYNGGTSRDCVERVLAQAFQGIAHDIT